MEMEGNGEDGSSSLGGMEEGKGMELNVGIMGKGNGRYHNTEESQGSM